jgi:Domain of unknown function (DUF1707)
MTSPRMRAGTTDRQTTVDLLSRHFTEGRLNAGEFDERVAKAYAATYLDELPELSVDLPAEEPRRGPGGRRPGPDGFGQFGPPGQWSGYGRPAQFGPGMRRPGPRRPPRFLAVFVVLAVIFSISAMANGFFPFPLIWLAVVLLLMSRGGHRRRWADYNSRDHHH